MSNKKKPEELTGKEANIANLISEKIVEKFITKDFQDISDIQLKECIEYLDYLLYSHMLYVVDSPIHGSFSRGFDLPEGQFELAVDIRSKASVEAHRRGIDLKPKKSK